MTTLKTAAKETNGSVDRLYVFELKSHNKATFRPIYSTAILPRGAYIRGRGVKTGCIFLFPGRGPITGEGVLSGGLITGILIILIILISVKQNQSNCKLLLTLESKSLNLVYIELLKTSNGILKFLSFNWLTDNGI